ncbi:unnamed protein product [Clonostachys solani]|uniref:Uncharacterized protein n=1 Tax=Clonostachys solani TaxID=160281 RepID=A0A9N9ZKJ4_9HYPO|nr:unnamed protein product [Clonostachys solani]
MSTARETLSDYLRYLFTNWLIRRPEVNVVSDQVGAKRSKAVDTVLKDTPEVEKISELRGKTQGKPVTIRSLLLSLSCDVPGSAGTASD